ncbi:hypothetical protein DFH11DRAFT_1824362 [Phellopilus nigrolimitatus]|nr:hypothetical protein DFH11DRAFT_1824362 [Phellopilus nigrolimitatus]
MAHHPQTACHRVLSTPELREHILSCVDEHRPLAQCATVCAAWSGSALDALWRRMSRIAPLFALAGRAETMSPPGQQETRRAWARFRAYARRIRELSLSSHDVAAFTRDTVSDICANAPEDTPFLLPKLRTLEISPCKFDPAALDFVVSLMHGSLEKLVLPLLPDASETAPLLDEVAARVPGLKSLCLRADEDGIAPARYERALLDALPKLQELEAVRFPVNALTAPIAEALSALPRLAQIQWGREDLYGCCPAKKRTAPLPPTLQRGAFPSLTLLEAAVADFASARAVLPFLPGLSGLRLQSRALESAEALRALLAAAARSCRGITALALDAIPAGLTLRALRKAPAERLAVRPETLHALHALPELRALSIAWPRALQLADGDVARLVAGLPALTRLALNCCPAEPGGASALSHPRSRWASSRTSRGCARSCARWRCTSTARRLRALDLGASRTPNQVALADYLSRVVPPACALVAERALWCGAGAPACAEGRWATDVVKIEEVFRALVRVRVKGARIVAGLKERIAALEGRVHKMEGGMPPSTEL